MMFLESKKNGCSKKIILFFLGMLFVNLPITANNISKDTIPTPKLISSLKNIFKKNNQDSLAFQKAEIKDRHIYKKDSVENIKNNKSQDSITKILKASVKSNYWTIKNKPGIILTQTSFVNWTKGGNNTIAGISSFIGDYNYKKGYFFWKNNVIVRYGISKEKGISYPEKTEDIIDLKSSVGYKTSIESKWYYSGEFNLTTQFANGYKGQDREKIISTFFAPARMRLGIGAVYTDEEDHFKLHLSPLTNQITFVLDEELSNRGAFGVDKGEKINSEVGALIRIEYKTILMKNINFTLKSSFYSDYLNKFGNVDNDIELNIDMKVNKYIHSRISSHLLYDDDAKILEDDGTETGARIQLKQILGIGVTYTF